MAEVVRFLKVFISYSHDSSEHNDRVLDLSDRLRTDGIDVTIDQYEPFPSEGWHRWMMNKVTEADFVLIVCTEKYLDRFMGDEGGGAEWEGAIITQQLYNAAGLNRKFVPIGFVPFGQNSFVPLVLQQWTYFDVSTGTGYEALYRHVTDQPYTIMPPLGTVRHLPTHHRQEITIPPSPRPVNERPRREIDDQRGRAVSLY